MWFFFLWHSTRYVLVLENLRSIVKSEKVGKRAPHIIPLPGDKDFTS